MDRWKWTQCPQLWSRFWSVDDRLVNSWSWMDSRWNGHAAQWWIPVTGDPPTGNRRPKLSFGIDAILSDQLGSKKALENGQAPHLWHSMDPKCQSEGANHLERDRNRNDSRPVGEATASGSDPANGNGVSQSRKRSWSRAVFSNLQRKGLEKRFQLQKYITKPDRRQLAATLGLTDAQVKVWFQNRRMKWRHSKEKNGGILGSPRQDGRCSDETNSNAIESFQRY